MPGQHTPGLWDSAISSCHQELAETGWDPGAARREARRRFGDPALYTRACRSIDRRRSRRLELYGLVQDWRYATRRFRQHPLVTTVVLATLALGIGAIYAATLAVVLLVGLAATLVPALRTLGIHPSRALRSL